MPEVKIFWDPKGIELDSLGKKKYLRSTDGDTSYISVSIRMLSIDTPEVHYPGNSKPSKQNENFKKLAEWINQGKAPVTEELGEFLLPKLETGHAGTLHEDQGKKATKEYENIISKKLMKSNGKKRTVFIKAANENFDHYGRLLAYMAPSYTKKELQSIPIVDRYTFNLLMIKFGWAASFPIYPSIPKYDDLILLQQCGKEAFENKKGSWENDKMLTGYEFRMCVRLYEITRKIIHKKPVKTNSWINRYCVDMTTREIFQPQDYHKIKPYNRIFLWAKDVSSAVGKMNLLPA